MIRWAFPEYKFGSEILGGLEHIDLDREEFFWDFLRISNVSQGGVLMSDLLAMDIAEYLKFYDVFEEYAEKLEEES